MGNFYYFHFFYFSIFAYFRNHPALGIIRGMILPG
jgi:hypothetical protein